MRMTHSHSADSFKIRSLRHIMGSKSMRPIEKVILTNLMHFSLLQIIYHISKKKKKKILRLLRQFFPK